MKKQMQKLSSLIGTSLASQLMTVQCELLISAILRERKEQRDSIFKDMGDLIINATPYEIKSKTFVNRIKKLNKQLKQYK